MIEQVVVDILIKKIKNQEINPKTAQPFQVDDIKIQEYKDVVGKEILRTQEP